MGSPFIGLNPHALAGYSKRERANSERILESDLDLAGLSGRKDLTEGIVSKAGIGASEINVIESVEELDTELEEMTTRKAGVLAEAQVPNLDSRCL